MSIVSQVNKETSNRCKFSSVFHMSTEIYQIDINLLYVLLTINRKDVYNRCQFFHVF